MNNILRIGFPLIAAAALAVSCTLGFEEANRPLNKVSDEELGRDNYNTGAFLVQMQNEAFPEQENTFQMNCDLIGNYLGRYMTYANNGFSASNFVKMNAPVNWVRFPFSDSMPKTVSAFNEVLRLTGKEGLSYAWALILRAQSFLRLTDMYGPLPIGLDENDPNAYSSQRDVYYSLITDLDVATEILSGMIAASGGSLVQFTDVDKVYGGNFTKWYKFANSLKLRMAIRMRFVEPEYARQVAENAVADGVIATNDENCTITYTPHGLYKTSVEWGDSRACADIESYMNGYADPRITKYFKTTETAGDRPVIGCRAGANVGNKATAGKLYSAANVDIDTKGVWMTAAEMTFCRAEGALAGWNMGGTAANLYNEAIALSFAQWGAGSAESYCNDNTAVQADYRDATGGYGAACAKASSVTIKWNDAASAEEKLERLIVQKWIALFPDGQEGWNEIRRTGYPKVFPVAQSTAYSIAVANRIPFDHTEAVNNPANYAKAVELLGGKDDYASKMWWQR